MKSADQDHESEGTSSLPVVARDVPVKSRLVPAVGDVHVHVQGDHGTREARRESTDADGDEGKCAGLLGIVEVYVELEDAAGDRFGSELGTFAAQCDVLENATEGWDMGVRDSLNAHLTQNVKRRLVVLVVGGHPISVHGGSEKKDAY